MPGQHALLSPSSGEIWINCTKSARYAEQFPKADSIYAAEGTLAHAIAELLIKYHFKTIDQLEYDAKMFLCELDDLYGGQLMRDYCEAFRDYCVNAYNELDQKDPHTLHLSEAKHSLQQWVPESYGTVDFAAIGARTLHIVDLKYGVGVEVNAVWNPQLLMYALAIYAKFYHFKIDTIRISVFQPRINNISVFELTTKDLLHWADTVLKPAARLAWNGEGFFKAGSHCKFCAGKAVCKTYSEHATNYPYNIPGALSKAELLSVLEKIDEMSHYVKAIKEYTLTKALEGEVFEGYKLVEGKSDRQLTAKAAEHVSENLVNAGYAPKQFYKPQQLLGITDLNRLLGIKKFKELVEPHLIKPKGKPTLAPLSDNRPTFNSVEDVFSNVVLSD